MIRQGPGQKEEEVLSIELDTAPLLLFTLPILLTGLGAVLGQLAAQSDTIAVKNSNLLKKMNQSKTIRFLPSQAVILVLMKKLPGAHNWFDQWDFWSGRRREQCHCCRHCRWACAGSIQILMISIVFADL